VIVSGHGRKGKCAAPPTSSQPAHRTAIRARSDRS
jgi:hypothetical protein